MTTVGLIRHGSTEWNRLGKLQGQIDTDLTDEGRNQAQLLGLRLRNEEWTHMISSDLSRAKETAQIISEFSGIPLTGLDMRLRERSFGLAEGLTLPERLERWGEDWRNLDLGGESNEDVWARWLDFATELSQTYTNDEKILLISHGGTIHQILRGLQLEREEFLQNTSISVIQRVDSSWNLLLYNCLSHLEVTKDSH
ncbi:Glucosyl-3-phosphoglycerate phosphatase [compost metagenome]